MAFGPDDRSDTRSRIVSLLRRGQHTVKELAAALGLTGNAIRAHLTILEGEGLIRPIGKRPGVRKPMTTYGLTPQADRLFPRLYGPILGHVLDVLKERATPPELDDFVRAVGRRVARDYHTTAQAGRRASRVRRALSVLQEFGGLCEPVRDDGKTIISCSDCPLAMVAEGRPEVCVLMETVLAEAIGVRVRQQCRSNPMPQCRFEIDAIDLDSA